MLGKSIRKHSLPGIIEKTSGNPGITKNSPENPGINEKNSENPLLRPQLPPPVYIHGSFNRTLSAQI